MVSITADINTVVPGAGVPARAVTGALAPSSAAVQTRSAGLAGANILGVTGLPRHTLAAMFRRDGLFGRDSALAPAEQAVVQATLSAIPGLKPRAIATGSAPHLAVLADYVSALAVGRAAIAERLRLEAAGLTSAAINEVATVVDNVLVVFQPKL